MSMLLLLLLMHVLYTNSMQVSENPQQEIITLQTPMDKISLYSHRKDMVRVERSSEANDSCSNNYCTANLGLFNASLLMTGVAISFIAMDKLRFKGRHPNWEAFCSDTLHIIYFIIFSFMAIAWIIIDAAVCNIYIGFAVIPVIFVFLFMMGLKFGKKALAKDTKFAADNAVQAKNSKKSPSSDLVETDM